MEPEDDQALWTLLGGDASPAKVSPYFARRVLREVALAEEARAAGWWNRLRNALPNGAFARRAALGSGLLSGACAALLLVATHLERRLGPVSLPSTQEVINAQPGVDASATAEAVPVEESPQASGQVRDVEVIADLDNALQREESRLWTEDSARF